LGAQNHIFFLRQRT